MSTPIKTIISHEFPDLDSILSIYLLKRYGKHKYPGVENAKLEFYPAGVLPEGKSPEELEKDGILVVDTGGGRFDTHPVGNQVDASKVDKCASFLVAEDLGVDQRPDLEQILTFSRLQDVEGQSLQSTDPVDHAFSLIDIIRGFNLVERFENTVDTTSRLLDALIAAEEERCKAPATEKIPINRCQRLQLIVSKHVDGAMIKMVRWPDESKQTHPEFLDMDSVLSVYLLRKYGVHKHPELGKAVVKFDLAENAAAGIEAFERDTLLLMVDTDTASDPPETAADNSTTTPPDTSTEAVPDTSGATPAQDEALQRKSAAALIATVLSLDTVPELGKFVAFARQLDPKAEAMEKMESPDRVVSIFNMLHGLNLLNGHNFEQTIREMESILDAIVAREKDWCEAVAQYKANAKVYKTGKKGKIKIVAVEAESGSAIKVSRWKDKADLTLCLNPTQGHLVIVTRQNGPLHNFRLSPLAELARTAEAVERKEKVDFKKLNQVGEVHGWFLHPSEKILSKGSPKATHIAPTRIPFEVLTDLVLSHFDKDIKLPDQYCPPDRCTGETCAFFHLKLLNCYAHRERLEFKNSSLGSRLNQDIIEQLRKLKQPTK